MKSKSELLKSINRDDLNNIYEQLKIYDSDLKNLSIEFLVDVTPFLNEMYRFISGYSADTIKNCPIEEFYDLGIAIELILTQVIIYELEQSIERSKKYEEELKTTNRSIEKDIDINKATALIETAKKLGASITNEGLFDLTQLIKDFKSISPNAYCKAQEAQSFETRLAPRKNRKVRVAKIHDESIYLKQQIEAAQEEIEQTLNAYKQVKENEYFLTIVNVLPLELCEIQLKHLEESKSELQEHRINTTQEMRTRLQYLKKLNQQLTWELNNFNDIYSATLGTQMLQEQLTFQAQLDKIKEPKQIFAAHYEIIYIKETLDEITEKHQKELNELEEERKHKISEFNEEYKKIAEVWGQRTPETTDETQNQDIDLKKLEAQYKQLSTELEVVSNTKNTYLTSIYLNKKITIFKKTNDLLKEKTGDLDKKLDELNKKASEQSVLNQNSQNSTQNLTASSNEPDTSLYPSENESRYNLFLDEITSIFDQFETIEEPLVTNTSMSETEEQVIKSLNTFLQTISTINQPVATHAWLTQLEQQLRTANSKYNDSTAKDKLTTLITEARNAIKQHVTHDNLKQLTNNKNDATKLGNFCRAIAEFFRSIKYLFREKPQYNPQFFASDKEKQVAKHTRSFIEELDENDAKRQSVLVR